MVMHARKTQRISDGYFEKHPAHPYQNLKYSSSRGGSYANNDRYSERPRDSPNGNSYRSDSPEDSPHDRDRSYSNKSSYLQKIREKEREKRDYQSSRDKYAECLRSPKDKRSRESESRTNHDRNDDDKLVSSKHNSAQRDRKSAHNCHDKREEREKINRMGDWSEHISSSGKKYYYNCKTEVSQWEKPREWIERMSRSSGSSSTSVKEHRSEQKLQLHTIDRHSSRSSSSSIGNNSNYRGSDSVSKSTNLNHHKWNERNDRNEEHHHSHHSSHNQTERSSSKRDEPVKEKEKEKDQDMDISPGGGEGDRGGGDSTPTTSEAVTTNSKTSSSAVNCNSSDTPTKKAESSGMSSGGPILLATALPRLSSLSSPEPLVNHNTPNSVLSPTTTSANTAVVSTSCSATTTANCNSTNNSILLTGISLPRMYSSTTTVTTSSVTASSAATVAGANTSGGSDGASAGATPVTNMEVDEVGSSLATAGTLVSEGPPTPTHSECPELTIDRKLSSPPSTLSSLGVLRPQGPSITPSLANHCRDDLTNHVKGWPSDLIEKQAQKHSEEAQVLGSIQCAKVSADLKIARAIVRSTEIQATLQEQRILFLRQQIKALEELKSQNSFMSENA